MSVVCVCVVCVTVVFVGVDVRDLRDVKTGIGAMMMIDDGMISRLNFDTHHPTHCFYCAEIRLLITTIVKDGTEHVDNFV